MSSLQVSRQETAARLAEVEASALYEQHRHLVYRFCLGRLGDREEAHDAVQDTYAKAWLALRDGCEVREPLAWLLTIARNVCASRHRARQARPIETTLSENTVATVTYLQRTELSDLPAAVRALPDEQRRAFVLRELRGCSYDEICDTMGASQASVAALLHRARRSVASALAGTGRRALVVVPFPAVLRSAFEGGGAMVAASAAATATAAGTMLFVAPHLPIPHHPEAPAKTRVQPAADVRAPVGASHGIAGVDDRVLVRTSSRQQVAARPDASSATGSSAPAAAAPVSATTRAGVTDTVPVGSSPPSESASDGTAPALEPPSGTDVSAETSGTTNPIVTAPATGATDAPTLPVATQGGDEGTDDDPADQSNGNGPPDDPGAQGEGNGGTQGQGNGNGGSQGQGNGPPADPGSQGNGHTAFQGQGNGPPADPGAQGNGNGGTKAQGNGPSVDPGSQSQGQGAGNGQGQGKAKGQGE